MKFSIDTSIKEEPHVVLRLEIGRFSGDVNVLARLSCESEEEEELILWVDAEDGVIKLEDNISERFGFQLNALGEVKIDE